MTKDEAIAEVARFGGRRRRRAGRRDLAAGAYAFAINRAYYALFYAVSALLHLIKTGRLSRKHGDLYNELFDKRLEADYIELSRFEASYVQEKLEACEAFLSDLRPLLTSLPPDARRE